MKFDSVHALRFQISSSIGFSFGIIGFSIVHVTTSTNFFIWLGRTQHVLLLITLELSSFEAKWLVEIWSHYITLDWICHCGRIKISSNCCFTLMKLYIEKINLQNKKLVSCMVESQILISLKRFMTLFNMQTIMELSCGSQE